MKLEINIRRLAQALRKAHAFKRCTRDIYVIIR